MPTSRFRFAHAVALASSVALAACSDTNPSSPLEPTAAPVASLNALGGAAAVVVPVGDVGTFGSFIANNSGRDTSEFWDNLSADNVAVVENCNIGHYASNAFDAGCTPLNIAVGTLGNQGAFSSFYGDQGGKDAAGFRFAGGRTYTVKLAGSIAGEGSVVGWYRVSGGTYVFTEVPEWSAKQVGFTVEIDPGGDAWGFFISNRMIAAGGCGTMGENAIACTDATGGFTAPSFQQFALFKNADDTEYLVGAEDNLLGLVATAYPQDSDYQDYIWRVLPRLNDRICDFITFGRLITEVGGQRVVVSGNTGGNAPFTPNNQTGILNQFRVDVGGTTYQVDNVDVYGSIASGPLSGRTNARRAEGIATNGQRVEIRLWDGGEPGRGTDRLWVRIGDAEPVIGGDDGRLIDQGNIQYHPQCRGPR